MFSNALGPYRAGCWTGPSRGPFTSQECSHAVAVPRVFRLLCTHASEFALVSSRSPIHAQHYSPLVLSVDRNLIEALGSRKLESFELQFEMLHSGIKMAAVATIFESPCLGPFRSRSRTKLAVFANNGQQRNCKCFFYSVNSRAN